MDKFSATVRSKLMSRIKSKNTNPELRVRSVLHALGYRFRINRRDLPGTPDIVLPKYQLCIFVHGCFWHRHLLCKRATMPATRRQFWEEKFSKNVYRDKISHQLLLDLGWQVLTIWECQTRKTETIVAALDFLFKLNERNNIESSQQV